MYIEHKKIILNYYLIVLALRIIPFGQNINQRILVAGGDYFDNINSSVKWSLGEVSIENT